LKPTKVVIATTGITGAFLNSDMQDEVIVIMEAKLAKIIVDILPKEYWDFLGNDGGLIFKLDKALYGLDESENQKFDIIRRQLLTIEFAVNTKDPCVFHKTSRGNCLTELLYVDALLVTSRCPYHVLLGPYEYGLALR
jgi:hypothetical protein